MLLTSLIEIEQFINRHEMILIYFSGNACSVCKTLKPKVNEVLNQYPMIHKIEVDTEKSVEIAAQYQIFTVPAILFFIDGKEVIRELRHISIVNLEEKISRYNHIYYK